jgi:ADP-heptose:LPS heptosyltransferase/2-polyprenyl-3-methyl-5-hydroxy-6-metoxy-1,4-benzoquinol methylase
MTHRGRILADRILAVPLAFLFNGAARFLGKLLRREHSVTSQNVKVIVVAKLIGMGSILQCTPLLRALKHRYPAARLIFVTLPANRELLLRLSSVDEILVLDDRSLLAMAVTTLRTIASLIRLKADLYFDLEVYSGFASLLALWAVTRNRLGFYRHSAAFKKGIYTHLVYFNTRMPVRRLYLQLGRMAGVPAGENEFTGPILVHDHERAAVHHLLANAPGWQPENPYIVVNPNASDLLLERRWPTAQVIEAIHRLVYSGCQVALMGAPNEAGFVRSLFEMLSPETQFRVVNTAGRLSLGELLALLDGAACVLTNDTGPMHMAIALQRPTVCLFGPANPEHYGQDLPFVEIFYGQVFCSPCLYEADKPPCNGNNTCMQIIPPEPVVEAVLRLARSDFRFGEYEQGGRTSGLHCISETPDGTPLGIVVRPSQESNTGTVRPECIACSTPMVPRFGAAVPEHWRCPDCGLECISPQPDDQTLSGIYNELYFSHYRSAIHPEIIRAMKRATYERQMRRLPSPERFGACPRLLDCGAATGFLAELAKQAGWDVFAVEISEFGSQKCIELLSPERVYRGEVLTAEFSANPENRFDVITMFDFIEHVRNPRDVLKWARNRLNPGGVLLLTTPRVGTFSWRLMGRHWYHYVREHLWFLNPKSIRTLLKEAGFSSVEAHPLAKSVTVEYALAHYARSNSYSRFFSPVAIALNSFLPAMIKRQRAWCYLGEMAVTACAGEPADISPNTQSPQTQRDSRQELVGGTTR